MRQALAMQLGIPYLALDRMTVDRSLSRFINRNYARRHTVVPVAVAGQMLTICMDDPTQRGVVEELTRSTGKVITVVTASHESIGRALLRLYEERVEARPTETLELLSEEQNAPSKSKYAIESALTQVDVLVRQLMSAAISRRVSDIHLEMLSDRLQIRFRVDGVLEYLEPGELHDSCSRSAREVISRLKILGKLDITERRRPQDGSFRVKVERKGKQRAVDFRVSVIPSHYGESVVLRILDGQNAPSSLDQLSFPPAVTNKLRELLNRPSGILLVTGPTGSGKSTTLYASLMTVSRPGIRILTAEDPIEYVFDNISQAEVNEQIGNTFAAYLRAFLRHDPEVIMVGEIRDQETAEMAFRAAQTGHLLLSTLHTDHGLRRDRPPAGPEDRPQYPGLVAHRRRRPAAGAPDLREVQGGLRTGAAAAAGVLRRAPEGLAFLQRRGLCLLQPHRLSRTSDRRRALAAERSGHRADQQVRHD